MLEWLRSSVLSVLAGALEKLDVVAAPSTQSSSPLQAVLEALKATQAMLESSQTARFGAKVRLWLFRPPALSCYQSNSSFTGLLASETQLAVIC